VASAAHRHLEAVFSSQTDGCAHVSGMHDQRREAVNPANKNGAVVRVERLDYRSFDPRTEGVDWDHSCAPATESDVSIDANVSTISPLVKVITRYCFR
jgi:hypothetical protein